MEIYRILFFLGLFLRETTPLGGVFELSLSTYSHPTHRTTSGLCCSPNESLCTTPCTPRFRICVKNYQVVIDPSGGCFFGETLTEVGGGVGREFHFPFNFRWPGTFSLIIEAFQPSEERSRNATSLLTRLAIQQYLDISPDWKSRTWNDSSSTINYSYRVRCLPDYYGESCDKTCRPRDDKFGHYECLGDGDRKCLEGWEGEYCDVATCPPSCSPTHATCHTPLTCTCHSGYSGPSCTTCTPYPGCKHGRCDRPFECNCDEGWGGLFCNQDLNYCTNHTPCLNGGTCFNTGQGSYTCECAEGWGGVDCEVRGWGGTVCGCGNGGVCRDNGTTLFCDCPEPYTGPKCHTLLQTAPPPKPLPSTCPCLNNGTCSTTPTGLPCTCPLGYIDDHCSTPINICSTHPCANGGTCSNQGNGFVCYCRHGFTGVDCSEKCLETCLLSMETEELREELSTQHVVIVVVVSIATPLMVVVAGGVVVLLKRRKEEERRRGEEVAGRENEENERRVGGGGVNGGRWDKNLNNIRKKENNLEKGQPPHPPCSYSNTLPPHSPLLLDPYNPPPPGLNSLLVPQQTSPVILNKFSVYNVNLATEV